MARLQQTPHDTLHRARSARPEGHSGWRERGERPEEALRPCQAPGAEPAPTRILGNGEAKRGKGKRAAVAVASGAEQERQKSMQEGAEEGRGRKAPPRSSWAGPGRALGRPRPSGPCCAGLAPGVGPSSLLLHAASLAQRVQPGLVPRQPPAAGSSVPSLPWGWGLVTKVPVGLWSGEHGGRFSSESSPRARPASGPAQGRMSRGAVCHHLVF